MQSAEGEQTDNFHGATAAGAAFAVQSCFGKSDQYPHPT